MKSQKAVREGGLCCIAKVRAENRLRFRCERRPYRAESVMVEANVRAESVNQCRENARFEEAPLKK